MGRTTCPKCKHEFVLDLPENSEKHEVICPKCENKYAVQIKCPNPKAIALMITGILIFLFSMFNPFVFNGFNILRKKPRNNISSAILA